MVAKGRQNTLDSYRVEVGEIDTSAPFQSVKDAVTLFGEGAFSGEKPSIKKPKPQSAERVLAKETQLHLARKELNKLKDQLKNAEDTKAQALVELEKAKRTVDDLTNKLKVVNESKDSAIKATEAAKNQAKQIEESNCDNTPGSDGARKQDLETAREKYVTVFTELDAAKQELRKFRQDCDATLEAKVAAFNLAAEAENAAKANMERVSELSKEIAAVQESIGQVKLATLESQQEQAKVFADKDVQRQSYRATIEDSAKKLLALKKQFDPELSQTLETQLTETMNEIAAIQKQMENAKASDLDSVKTVTSELDDAKGSLQKVAEEESSLQSLVESLKVEIENVKKEHSELKEKEAETESIAGSLHVKLRKSKSELEALRMDESKVRGVSEEMISTLQQLSLEMENARQEAEEMKNKAKELKKEAEATKITLEEAEKKLRVALEEAEEAKEAEARALDQIKACLRELMLHGLQFQKMKVGAAMAQVEAVKASENEALKRLEATQKEIEDMKAATEEALKRAEMAEAAKKAVEGELRRWREREQKKAAEAAARILAETEMSSESSPHHYRMQKHPSEKIIESHKLDKEKTSLSKKTLMPNISGIFHRKKNQVEGGSPSYLPGEKLV
ncbi:hypothetical protein JRO89_XS15G0183200 [Xanthoceras sorbifolium]|uniref:WEB family protein n=1 Tax=Xanthoceras sorbifolium TaxID=99658 RepID=A0ABQ8H2X2_9ROSI|nr:hypothetical protein JRO89_XS15G0183200 [Xanthoceras sorbifolium]